MRSLFVDDIPGAKPTNRYYQKSLIRQRHDKQIQRFGNPNPQAKRNIEWYVPLKRWIEPVERPQFTMKILGDPDRLKNTKMSIPVSKMEKYYEQVTGKITQQSPKLHKSTILSGSGLNSLQKNPEKSPYFPHIYSNSELDHLKDWSGQRGWNQQITSKIQIPKVNSQYFPKWT